MAILFIGLASCASSHVLRPFSQVPDTMVTCLAPDPEGERILACETGFGANAFLLKIYSVRDRKAVTSIPLPAPAFAAVFIDKGSRVAIASQGDIRLADIATGKILSRTQAGAHVSALHFDSATGTLIAGGYHDAGAATGFFSIFQVHPTFQRKHTVTTGGPIVSIASRNSIVAAIDEGTLHILPLADLKARKFAHQTSTLTFRAVGFIDDTHVAVGGQGGYAITLDVHSMKVIASYGQTSSSNRIAFLHRSPGSSELLIALLIGEGESGGMIRYDATHLQGFNISDRKQRYQSARLPSVASAFATLPGNQIVIGFQDGRIILIE